jgi:hypothetical protein
VAVLAEIDRQQPVEMGQAFLGEQVEGQGGAGRVGDAGGQRPQAPNVLVWIGARGWSEDLARVPDGALLLVRLHHLADRGLEVPEDLDFGAEPAVDIGKRHRSTSSSR